MAGVYVRREGAFKTDEGLLFEIGSILAPSYHDATSLLAREWSSCNTCYEFRNSSGELLAFFLVEWPPAQSVSPSAYLGLSATRSDTKNSGIVRELYRRFVVEATAWQESSGKMLRLWYTTATPSACLAAYTLLSDPNPRSDGSFDPVVLPEVDAIRNILGIGPCRENDHHFVLRGLAAATRYSEEERLRITKIVAQTGFTLLDDLGVAESNGDRLLYLCRVPTQNGAL